MSNFPTSIVRCVRHPISKRMGKQCLVRELPKKRRRTEVSAPLQQLAALTPSAGKIILWT